MDETARYFFEPSNYIDVPYYPDVTIGFALLPGGCEVVEKNGVAIAVLRDCDGEILAAFSPDGERWEALALSRYEERPNGVVYVEVPAPAGWT